MSKLIAASRLAEPKAPTLWVQPIQRARAIHNQLNDVIRFRQIDEFSFICENIRRKGFFQAFILICFSLICLALFIAGINVVVFFSAGALLMIIQLIKSVYEFSQEETRTRVAYHHYLNTFSSRALFNVRKTASLSAWSKYELDRYLERL